MLFLDALGLAVFTVVGTQKAMALGFSDPIAIMTGIMTGVVGGVMRDVLVGEVPLVFRKEIYATASFIGASIFLTLEELGLSVEYSVFISIILILSIRVWAIMHKIELPVFISYKESTQNVNKMTSSNSSPDKRDSKIKNDKLG